MVKDAKYAEAFKKYERYNEWRRYALSPYISSVGKIVTAFFKFFAVFATDANVNIWLFLNRSHSVHSSPSRNTGNVSTRHPR